MAVVGTVSVSPLCADAFAVTVTDTGMAAEYTPLPPCVAVTTHGTAPLVIVTVVPVIEQPPETV